MTIGSPEWALWLAVAALVAALGKFVDDYYINHEAKSKIRELLVRAFIALDNLDIPDLGGKIARTIYFLPGRIGWKFVPVIVVATVPWFALLFIYLLVTELVEPLTIWYDAVPRFLQFLYANVMLVGVIPNLFLTFVISITSTFVVFKLIAHSRSNLAAFLWSLCGVVIAIAASLFFLLSLGPFGFIIIGILAIPSLLPVIAISVLVGLLLSIQVSILLLRKVFMLLCDTASDPQYSPFSYATALVSLAILTLKVINELVA